MSNDSTHAIWVDPLAFDPAENGAPYFPEKSQMRTANGPFGEVFPKLYQVFRQIPMGEMGALVALLRAASHVHQTHHWQTKGGHFYSDHLLFMRLYDDSQGFIDQVAERGVGTGSPLLVDARLQIRCVDELINLWCSNSLETSDEMVVASLVVERCVLQCIAEARNSLEASGQLSNGIDNLLQGVADKHEEFVYLLQQRSGSRMASTYDRR